jgi:ribosomal protein S18 acetylase RimI-like enzyme
MITIQPLDAKNRDWARRLLADSWGSVFMVSRSVLHNLSDAPGLVACDEGKRVGLLLYRIDGDECEIMSLDSLKEGIGVGTALLSVMRQTAREAGCKRLWLITTNDNTHALRFYQKRGFRLVALYPNALDDSRLLKPEIPLIGLDEIPLRDEIELEITLL